MRAISLKESAYSVLIVSASDVLNRQLEGNLPEHVFSPVTVVKSENAAQRKLVERSFDLIFINTPLPDEFGSRLAVDLAGRADSVVMMLAKSELYDELLDKVGAYGVLVMKKPASLASFLQAADWMRIFWERLHRMQKKNISLNEKMAEIRLVNHAKWVLIEEHGMSEEEAHHKIEHLAMDFCISKKEVAEQILKGEHL